MFNYEQRQIDDKARDSYDRTFGHGKYAKEVKDDKPTEKVCKEDAKALKRGGKK